MQAALKESDLAKLTVPGGETKPKTTRLHEETWWFLDHLVEELAAEVGREVSQTEAIEFALQPKMEEWQARHPNLRWKPTPPEKKAKR